MKLNLDKLLYNPTTNPLTVQLALQTQFEVETTPRNEPLFNWQMLCKTNGELKLIIRYGWSERKEQWYFEPLSKRTLQC